MYTNSDYPIAPRMVRVLVEVPRTGRRLGYDVDLANLVSSLMQEIEETEGVLTSACIDLVNILHY